MEIERRMRALDGVPCFGETNNSAASSRSLGVTGSSGRCRWPLKRVGHCGTLLQPSLQYGTNTMCWRSRRIDPPPFARTSSAGPQATPHHRDLGPAVPRSSSAPTLSSQSGSGCTTIKRIRAGSSLRDSSVFSSARLRSVSFHRSMSSLQPPGCLGGCACPALPGGHRLAIVAAVRQLGYGTPYRGNCAVAGFGVVE